MSSQPQPGMTYQVTTLIGSRKVSPEHKKSNTVQDTNFSRTSLLSTLVRIAYHRLIRAFYNGPLSRAAAPFMPDIHAPKLAIYTPQRTRVHSTW